MLMLASLAFAQEPQTFEPAPVDHVAEGGVVLKGILVDEATYAELGALRVQVKSQATEIGSFEEWKAAQSTVFDKALTTIKEEHTAGQERLTTHYEGALKKAKRKDGFQRHSFPIGMASGFFAGVVVTTVLTVAVVNAYDGTLPESITR